MAAVDYNKSTSGSNTNESSSPQHSKNDPARSSVDKNPEDSQMATDIARSRFLDRVSSGIAVLEQQHGYSSERAASLILEEIRQGCDPPSKDEIFIVMEKMGLSLDDASKTATIANAFKKARLSKGLSSSDAIDSLSSQLTIMRLVKKAGIDKNKDLSHCGRPCVLEPLTGPTKRNHIEGHNKIGSIHTESNNSRVHPCRKNHQSKINSQKVFKTKLMSRAPPVKVSRKRSHDNSNTDIKSSDLVKTGKEKTTKESTILGKAQKILQSDSTVQRTNQSSPSSVRSKRGINHHGESLDAQQPSMKRPR